MELEQYIIYKVERVKLQMEIYQVLFMIYRKALVLFIVLQFTRNPMTDAPYVSKSMVDGYIDTLMEGNGFWDVTAETLDQMSEDIAAEFGFTVDQAAN